MAPLVKKELSEIIAGAAALAPSVSNTTNIQTNIVSSAYIYCGPERDSPFPNGWPPKWPPLAVAPRPFRPPSFTISLDILRRALASNAGSAGAFRRGDPAAVAALFTEIVRLIHADPRERNIYMNPQRADQVLVYVPERWEVMTLVEGIRFMMDHAVDELDEAMSKADPHLQSLAAGAQAGFRARKDEVVQNSRGAICAHLENMRTLHGTECWLGGIPDGDEPLPRMFCAERHGHIRAAALVSTLEDVLGLADGSAVPEPALPAAARRALTAFARMLLAGHPENLTAVLLNLETALVHTPWGWKERPAAGAAAELAAALIANLVDFIRAQPGPTPLAPVAAYLEANAAAMAGEEGRLLGILGRYSAAAERYYAKTTRPDFSELRQELRQKLRQKITNA